MDVWKIKRWHWGIMGVFLGLFMANQQRQTLSSPDPNRGTIPTQELEHLLRGTIENQPQLDQIVLYPTSIGYRLLARELRFQESVFTYSEISVDVPRRFRPQDKVRPAADELDFPDYMLWAADTFPHLHFQYNWWEEPPWLFSSYMAAGALLGAGVWPLALSLLAGGRGFSQRGEQTAYDRSLFKVKTTLTENSSSSVDPAALAATIAAFERQSDHPRAEETAAPMPTPAIASPNRLLAASDMEKAIETGDLDSEPAKHFGGDFYPTELHPDDQK
jgi:hypothetical protein